MSKIRVLVVDDHPLMREALCAAIETDEGMEVVGEAANGLAAVQQARTLQPDVIIMDLLMPGMNGLEAIAAIHAEFPKISLLALTSSTEEGKVLAAVQSGALGYLLKDAQREELLHAIRQISQGEPYLPQQAVINLMRSVRRPLPAPPPPSPEPPDGQSPERLTPRQKEVLGLLGQGLSNREIAERLVVSEATVRSHIYHILGILGLENRSQAVAFAARR